MSLILMMFALFVLIVIIFISLRITYIKEKKNDRSERLRNIIPLYGIFLKKSTILVTIIHEFLSIGIDL